MAKLPPREVVFCTAIDNETYARENGGQLFCALCGSTDHEVIPTF